MKLVDYRHAILPKTCPKTLSADQYNTWDPGIVNYVSGRMENAWNRVIYPAGCNCFMRGYFHDTIPFNNNADHAILLWQNLGNMHFGRFYRTLCTGYDMLTVFIRPLENGRIMPWQCPSVRLSVRPSVRPYAFSGLFSTWFEISIWNLVYTFSRC